MVLSWPTRHDGPPSKQDSRECFQGSFYSSLSRPSKERVLKESQVLIWLFFAFAMLAAVFRTILSWRMNRSFYLDDCMLLIGCICLISQTVLLYEMTPNLYLFQPLQSTKISALTNAPADISERWAWFEKCNYAFIAIAWTTIFSIKFSFLCFFRRLIDRLRGFIIYWRVVVAFNIVAWALSVCHPFISCPRFDFSAGKSRPSIDRSL